MKEKIQKSKEEIEDPKLKYPRDANGICTGCGCPPCFHKKGCPADVGRQGDN